MPTDESLSRNQLGVPYTRKSAVCMPPPLKLALTVAVEPATLAVLNQLLGMVVSYRRVSAAPLGPLSWYVETLCADAPARLALMPSAALETLEWPYSS